MKIETTIHKLDSQRATGPAVQMSRQASRTGACPLSVGSQGSEDAIAIGSGGTQRICQPPPRAR